MKDIHEFNAGQFRQQYGYRCFSPVPLNCEWLVSEPEIHTLLDQASRLLGELNAFSQLIPDVDFFIRMHIAKEATTSSRIEGTQTNIEDALLDEKDIEPEKRDDWKEVQNYIHAINWATQELGEIPLSNRLLKNTHRILLEGVRGKHKQPGEFRQSQNWIGISLKHATFIPPHHDDLSELMSDLEKFIHNDQIHVPHLIKIALIHYQFETIHPFLDGNGRIGRLMIVLYLVGFGLLSKPALYLSDFFERHKGEYYDQLMAVRTTSNIIPWLKFFLVGVCETAEQSIQVFKDILAIKERIERGVLPCFTSRRQANVQQLMRYLYGQPVVSIKQVKILLDTTPNTAGKLVDDLVGKGILRELTGRQRDRLFIFDEYVRLFIR
jgi:Fic family protein